MQDPIYPSNEEEYADYVQFLHDGGNAVFPTDDDCHDDDDDDECNDDEPWDGFRDDVDADADALASAGWGTDEDYGYCGGDDY